MITDHVPLPTHPPTQSVRSASLPARSAAVSPGVATAPGEADFTQLGRLGRTSWRRHLAAVATIVGFWVVLGGVVTVLAMRAAAGDDPAGWTGGSLGGYLVVNASLLCLLVGVAVAVRYVHHRPVRSLITSRRRVDVRRVLQGFAVFTALLGATRAVQALWHPDQFALTTDLLTDPGRWLVWAPVVLLLTPLQAAAEELFFRGYALQALGLLTRRTWVLVAISAVLFAAPHALNPELLANPLPTAGTYLLAGTLLAVVTLRDNRLELAIGVHAANNVFVVLVVNHPYSALPSPAIWSTPLDPGYDLVTQVLAAVMFCLLLVRRPATTRPRAVPVAATGSAGR